MNAQEFFLVIMLVAVAVTAWFIFVLMWLFSFDATDAKIKFKAFRSFYAINSRRWDLCDSYVGFRDDKLNYTYFRFSLFDYHRYVLWKAKEKHFRKTMESNRKCNDVVSQIKKDIEDFESKNKADTQSALEKIWGTHLGAGPSGNGKEK